MSNVKRFDSIFGYGGVGKPTGLILDLSKWDVTNGESFSKFASIITTLDISSFGENQKLNTGMEYIDVTDIKNLIIDGKYVNILGV